MADLIIERDGTDVAVVTLNRPQVLNALSRALEAELRTAIVTLEADDSVNAIVLTGAGRAFSAGVDLKEAGKVGFGARSRLPDQPSLSAIFEALTTPVIGAVNGFAITGGFELALMCDVRIASSAARFADTHARIGVVPGWGLSQRLPRLIGAARAKELSLTGNYIDAQTASAWGVVNRVVEPDELMPAALELAHDMAQCAGPVQTTIKALIDASMTMGLDAGLANERARSDEYNQSITGEAIESRRKALWRRGRDQQ